MPVRCLFYLFALIDLAMLFYLFARCSNPNGRLKKKLPAIDRNLSRLAALLITVLLVFVGLLLIFNHQINRLGAILTIAMLGAWLCFWNGKEQVFNNKEPDFHAGFCSAIMAFFIAGAHIAGYVVAAASG